MGKSPCCEKVGLKRGRWTSEEDEILTNYIQANGEGSWRSLPKNAGLLRCGKSCRLRWMNYLRADLKRGNITTQEEETIVKLHSALGNKWSLIASQLPGRTDNEIKNYWNSHLRRKIYSFTNTRKHTITKQSLDNINALTTTTKGQSKRKGGRTSQSIMEKHKSVGNYGDGQQSDGIALSSIAVVETGEVLRPSELLDNEIQRLQIEGVEPSVNGENGMVIKQVIVTDQHHDEEKDVNGVQKDDKNDDDDGERYGIGMRRSSNSDQIMMRSAAGSSSSGNSGLDRHELEVDYWENCGGLFYDDQWDDSDEVFCWLVDGNKQC